MTLRVAPDAQELYRRTLDRAASRQFIIEWSSEAEAENLIEQAFETAACVNEIAEGRPAGEERVLDLSETRMVAAALTVAAGGDRLVAADEASHALRLLQGTIADMARAPVFGRPPVDELIARRTEHAHGFRRLSTRWVENQIRAIFGSSELAALGTTATRAVHAVYASFVLSFQAGGRDEDISPSDTFSASALLEMGLRSL